MWYRYIDDIVFIWTHGEEKLKLFLDDLNKYPPNINFTHESNKEWINFLDLTVSLLDNKVSTDLHIKPTDRHQYFHYSSSHPDHTKKSLVYNQTLRLNRICSVEANFVRHKKEMKSWFSKRGYPKHIINREEKWKRLNLKNRCLVEEEWQRVPLEIMYHSLLKSVGSILCRHLHLLHMDKEVKKGFSCCTYSQL